VMGKDMARRSLAVGIWAAGLAFLGYAALTTTEGVWGLVMLGLGGAAFGAVGLILTLRHRGSMGWLFLLYQLLMGLSLASIAAANGPLMIVTAWILLLFPSGGLPSRRWRPAGWALLLATVGWALFDLFKITRGNDNYSWLVFMALVVPVLILGGVRLVNEYRHARSDTRQQLKWLALVFIGGGSMLLLSLLPLPYIEEAHNLAGVVLLAGSPIAIGIAITRYRLYEIDRIVSRTVSYAVVATLLAGVVAVVAAAVGTRFHNPLVVAGTTLGVAAAFNPLRIRVQRLVDRRFNRSKYDHERIAQVFAASLRDRVDPDQIVAGWTGVVSQTMEPRSMAVWTKVS
jgi:MFS family permease